MRQLEGDWPSGLGGVGPAGRLDDLGRGLTDPSAADRVSHVSVVVPARDEEKLIGRCLDSVERASQRLRHQRPDVTVEVIVVLDSCTDGTAQVVARHEGVTAVAVEAARVGTARQAGIRHGAERATARSVPAERSVDDVAHWVANTDADTVVPPSWLLDQLARAEHPASGCDVVVGVALPDPAELAGDVLALWHAGHRLVEGHEHVHGANLAFRLSSYLDAGGFEPLSVHEDVRLVERLRATGARVAATARVQVRTSARTAGRAPRGFAAYLSDLANGTPVVDASRAGSGKRHVGCVAAVLPH